MNKHVEKAMELRNEIPMVSNCSQAIMRTYAEELNLTDEQASAIACNFGGGMKCGGVCGAVTSALMVLGAKGVTNPAIISEFYSRIRENHSGYINCADLLKLNSQKGTSKKEHCDGMIKEAIELIDEIVK